MKAIANVRTTLVYRGDAEKGIGDLECERVMPGLIRSFWEPSPEELEKLNDGGVIELAIWGEPIPPVSVNALTIAESLEPF